MITDKRSCERFTMKKLSEIPTPERKKYIVVTGGQLYNKGAQAMVFITVDEIAKRYPGWEVVMLSDMDSKRDEEEKRQYQFQIQSYPGLFWGILAQGKAGRQLAAILGKKEVSRFVDLIRNAEALVDISGYALGSNWGYKRTLFYLMRVNVAKSLGTPVYLMPQSFGPFDYRGLLGGYVLRQIGRTLHYPRIIMCREQKGYELLRQKYGLDNVIKTPDLVLQNTGVDRENVYRNLSAWKAMEIPAHSVAVIPNQKTTLYGNPEQLFALYQKIVGTLLQQEKRVFLLYHSAEDLSICRQIKENGFQGNDNVLVVEHEMSCLELDDILRRFDFVIASRFHAIVHSYRNGIPALVLGWAAKYRELLSGFGQERFQFDVRGNLDSARILGAVCEMCTEYERFSTDIQKKVNEIQKENVYDYLRLEAE